MAGALFSLAPTAADKDRLVNGLEAGLKGGSAEEPPLILRKEVKALWTTRPHSPALISLATRLGLTEAMDKAVTLINDPKTSAADKRELTHYWPNAAVRWPSACYCNNSVPRKAAVAELKS